VALILYQSDCKLSSKVIGRQTTIPFWVPVGFAWGSKTPGGKYSHVAVIDETDLTITLLDSRGSCGSDELRAEQCYIPKVRSLGLPS
jgi:hypothetical protein